MLVYVLDIVSFVGGGGRAAVFASLEGAQAHPPRGITWEETVGNDGRRWAQRQPPGSLADAWVIDELEVKP